jgi:hypothetical protein
MGPGGDFGWLKKDYYFAIRGSANTEMARPMATTSSLLTRLAHRDTDNHGPRRHGQPALLRCLP